MASLQISLADPLLPTEEAADFVGKSPDCLRQWRFRGVGPRFIKAGKICVYRRSDLEAFKQAQSKQPGNRHK